MRGTPRLLGFTILVCVSAACAPRTTQGYKRYEPPGERLIAADEIGQTGPTNPWEAVQRSRTFLSTTLNSRGEPGRVTRRGRGSIVVRERPVVIIDGVRVSDVGALVTVPAGTIAWIRILTATASTAAYGAQGGSGAIIVQTFGADRTPVARAP